MSRMARKATAWVFLIALLASLCSTAPPPARAALVEYIVENGTQGNFGFSDLHDATGLHMQIDGVEYWAGGTVVASGITGSLFGDQQVAGSSVTLSGIYGTLTAGNGLTLTFTNGSLTGTTGGVYDAGGFLDVTLSHASITGGSRTETFYFHPEQFTSPPPGANTFDGQLFGLWGNNWNNGVDPAPTEGNTGTLNSNRLGLDIRAALSPVAPVPVPAAAWLFASGVMGLAGMWRRGVCDRRGGGSACCATGHQAAPGSIFYSSGSLA